VISTEGLHGTLEAKAHLGLLDLDTAHPLACLLEFLLGGRPTTTESVEARRDPADLFALTLADGQQLLVSHLDDVAMLLDEESQALDGGQAALDRPTALGRLGACDSIGLEPSLGLAASAASSASATAARTVPARASTFADSSSKASPEGAAAAASATFFSRAVKAAFRALTSDEARWATAAAAVSAAFWAVISTSAMRRFKASWPARTLSRWRSISSASLARRRACSAWRSALPPPSWSTGMTTISEAPRIAHITRKVSRPSRLSGIAMRIAITAIRSAATRNHFSLSSFSNSRFIGVCGVKGAA